MGVILIIAKQLLTTRWGLYAILAVLIVGGSAYSGWHYRGLQAESDQLAATRKAIEEYEEQAITDDRFIREVEVIKTIIVEKEIEVFRDAVKTNLCVNNNPSPDFRMLYNRAVTIANAETATSIDGATPDLRRFLPPVSDDEVVSIISGNMIKGGIIRRNLIWLQQWIDD